MLVTGYYLIMNVKQEGKHLLLEKFPDSLPISNTEKEYYMGDYPQEETGVRSRIYRGNVENFAT